MKVYPSFVKSLLVCSIYCFNIQSNYSQSLENDTIYKSIEDAYFALSSMHSDGAMQTKVVDCKFEVLSINGKKYEQELSDLKDTLEIEVKIKQFFVDFKISPRYPTLSHSEALILFPPTKLLTVKPKKGKMPPYPPIYKGFEAIWKIKLIKVDNGNTVFSIQLVNVMPEDKNDFLLKYIDVQNSKSSRLFEANLFEVVQQHETLEDLNKKVPNSGK
jgi:hypothetical protein